MIAAITEVIAHQWSPHTELRIMGTPTAEPIRSAPVIPITTASTPPALEETSIAAETTTPDRSVPAMTEISTGARRRARTTPIESMITGVTPARTVVRTTIETSTIDVKILIVVVRTIALVCRRA